MKLKINTVQPIKYKIVIELKHDELEDFITDIGKTCQYNLYDELLKLR